MSRILFVEDDIEVRPLFEHILLEAGHQVTAVESVRSATSLLANQPFDLVITDVNLPDGSGLHVADAALVAGVKVLVMTGQGLSLKSGDLAKYDYLLKPVRAPELFDAIKRKLAEATPGAEVIKLPKS